MLARPSRPDGRRVSAAGVASGQWVAVRVASVSLDTPVAGVKGGIPAVLSHPVDTADVIVSPLQI